MASEAPDPKSFKSWEDAFQYAIPAVRRMEQQLRSEISGNRERLRTLVGASYRDLLGTANSIVAMDEQIGDVETYLGDLSKLCNSRILEKSLSNLSLLGASTGEGDRGRYALMSQLAILKRCPEVITRLLRRGGSVLLAAKVLVLSRLLHKKLSKHPHTTGYVETLRERLAKLRRHLLAKVDHRLGDFTMSRDGLVDAMSAFSLVTSSSTADVLRYFHHVRLEAMTNRTANLQGNSTKIVEALRHWVQTLHETQAIFPRHIASSLLKLKSMPLFSDPVIHSMAEFDYDNHDRWIGDDIKHFIPYLIHDNLQSRAASDQLTIWASKTFDMFLQNIDGFLCSMNDPNDIESIRRECLELLISSRSYAVGVNLVEIMNKLREAFNNRLVGLVGTRCEALAGVYRVIDETIRYSRFTTLEEPGTLWTSTISSIDTVHDGPSFMKNLQASVIGISRDVYDVIVSYRKWLSGVERLESIIDRLRDTKWVEDIYYIDDEDDISEATEALRSAEDSSVMRAELSRSVSKSLDSLQTSIDQIAENLDSEQQFGMKAAYLLRVLRYTRHNLPLVCAGSEFATATTSTLQSLLSKYVVESTLAKTWNPMHLARTTQRVPGRVLWDGSPELPVIPSAWCLKLLRSLHLAMANIGSDLWSPEAVSKLKSTLRTRLLATSSAAFEGVGGINGHSEHNPITETTNGVDAKPTETENGIQEQSSVSDGSANDGKIQIFFDLMYIHWASASSGTRESSDSYYAHCGRVALETELAKDQVARVENNAGEYWKRTSLLFALLL